MKSLMAVIAGALYSMAYIAPEPYWQAALGLSAIFVIFMRSM